MRRAIGRADSLLADYLSGKVDLDHVLKSGGRTSTQRQELRVEQVGSVETEIPGIIDTAAAAPVLSKLEAAPPSLRPELSTDKRVLTVDEPIAKLNTSSYSLLSQILPHALKASSYTILIRPS